MKKFICLLFLFVAFGNIINATKDCKKCHGHGKVQTRYGMSSFGINNNKILCSYCNQWIFASETHWDPCDRCGGLGKIDDGWERKETNSNEIYVYLNPNDAEMLRSLILMRMKGTKQVQTVCNHCKGTGRCPVCNGSGIMMRTQPCAGCNMQGSCSACFGSRTGYAEVPLTASEIQLIEQRIRYFLNIAYSNMN